MFLIGLGSCEIMKKFYFIFLFSPLLGSDLVSLTSRMNWDPEKSCDLSN